MQLIISVGIHYVSLAKVHLHSARRAHAIRSVLITLEVGEGFQLAVLPFFLSRSNLNGTKRSCVKFKR